MAVKLAERSLDAIVARLQAQLPAELALIDAERADGIVLTAPNNADYYRRDKAEIGGREVHVEVFERSFSFDNPYSDSDAQRATYTIPLVLRVTLINSRGESADVMHRRIRRYGVGVFNVLNKAPTLGDSDPAVLIVLPQRVVPPSEIEGRGNPAVKLATEIPLLATCEETQT